MDSHPKEFVHDNKKWDNFLPPVFREYVHLNLSMYKYFTLVEKLAVYLKCKRLVTEVARPFAYGQILENIIDEGHK
jgi:hypothetical protein